MKFESKGHMARELLAGKRFTCKRSYGVITIYYDETYMGGISPFVVSCNNKGVFSMTNEWNFYSTVEWEEVKPRHVHQDLIDSYQEGQVWQCRTDTEDNWTDMDEAPSWLSSLEYRLHPHNDIIQAYRNGAEIQLYADGKWLDVVEPFWIERTEYRVKPKATKTVYEWVVKNMDSSEWVIIDRLLTEDEIKAEACADDVYFKTGRFFEVDV
jgi:hypothetical protein